MSITEHLEHGTSPQNRTVHFIKRRWTYLVKNGFPSLCYFVYLLSWITDIFYAVKTSVWWRMFPALSSNYTKCEIDIYCDHSWRPLNVVWTRNIIHVHVHVSWVYCYYMKNLFANLFPYSQDAIDAILLSLNIFATLLGTFSLKNYNSRIFLPMIYLTAQNMEQAGLFQA